MIFQDPAFDYRTFNVDRDIKAGDDLIGGTLNATDPDLRAFSWRGGKLLPYHGWSDAALPPTATIDYYRNVVAKIGQKDASAFVRLYMVPGMQHCGGGPGTDSFGMMPGLAPKDPDPLRNMSAALERWVEQGVAPAEIIATKFKAPANLPGGNQPGSVVLTRPLCPYPQVARYKGSGDTNDAANFTCANP